MNNEVRMSAVGQVGAEDNGDFSIGSYDQSGVLQFTVLRIPRNTGSQVLTPTAADTAGVNVINPGVVSVTLGANVTDVNDFVVLPLLASVPVGHCVTIVAGAANCEVRTPATINQRINNVDCDGTGEYLLVATQIHRFTKISDTIGWMGQGFTALGAVVTAVIPD